MSCFEKGRFACCRYEVNLLPGRNLRLTRRHVNCAQLCRCEGAINIDKCVVSHATIACLRPIPMSLTPAVCWLQWPSINVMCPGTCRVYPSRGGNSCTRNVDPGISAQFITWLDTGTCRQARVGTCWHLCLYPLPRRLLANYAEPGVSGVCRLNPVMVFILVCGH